MVRCRLQHGEGAPGRAPRSGNIGVCDVREAAGRERVASTAGNRPLFYFRFGERPPRREAPQDRAANPVWAGAGAGGVRGEPRPPTGSCCSLRTCRPGSLGGFQPPRPSCRTASGPVLSLLSEGVMPCLTTLFSPLEHRLETPRRRQILSSCGPDRSSATPGVRVGEGVLG